MYDLVSCNMYCMVSCNMPVDPTASSGSAVHLAKPPFRPGGARFARLGVVGAAKMTDPPEKPQPVFAGNIFTSAQVTIWKDPAGRSLVRDPRNPRRTSERMERVFFESRRQTTVMLFLKEANVCK